MKYIVRWQEISEQETSGLEEIRTLETSGQRRNQDKERSGRGEIRTRRDQDRTISGQGDLKTIFKTSVFIDGKYFTMLKS